MSRLRARRRSRRAASGSSCRPRRSARRPARRPRGSGTPPPISIACPRETTSSRPVGERRAGEQRRRRAVVDRERRLRAGQLAQQPFDVVLARAALAGAEVELEVGVAVRGARHRLARGGGQRCAAEVRVDDDAGRVEHAPQRRTQPRAGAVDEVGRRRRRRRAAPRGARPARRVRRRSRAGRRRAARADARDGRRSPCPG